jgi:UDPglucose 6-dehydrogenase/GDP-mannose 6-dehydrogenase
MHVSVVGAGYVGLITGLGLAEHGHQVVCAESGKARFDMLRRGIPPIHEHGLSQLLDRHLGISFNVTDSLVDAVSASDITIIAVGTPFDGNVIDLTQVLAAASQIGEVLRTKAGRHLVVVKSTVVPGTTDGPVRRAIEQASGLTSGEGFGLGTNPEFLTEGRAIRDFMDPDRIIIGASDAATLDGLAELYHGFADTPLIRTNNTTAEMIKYASNALLATMISFANEFGDLCDAVGDVDVTDVMAGLHASAYLTVRTGDSAAKAPITSFLEAGCGFGGSCLPKDVSALVAHGGAIGVDMRLLASALAVNKARPDRVLDGIRHAHGPLAGTSVTVLGLAFKEDTDDVRESPAFPVIERLLNEGARVTVYDPVAADSARQVLGSQAVRYADSLEQSVADAEVVVIITRWNEFRALPDVLSRLDRSPLVFDGRRLLDSRSVDHYSGVGLRVG